MRSPWLGPSGEPLGALRTFCTSTLTHMPRSSESPQEITTVIMLGR